jgi:hypothetical protein
MTVVPVSRCSQHSPLRYVWAARAPGQTDIAAAVEALMSAIRGNNRRWNMYTEAAARSEFRKRLERAERGDLKPVDHVKKLGRGSRADLFEIRWQDITVHEVATDGKVSYPKIKARLQHAEPAGEPTLLIGVHAHEKVVVKGDNAMTKSLQNQEIATGVKAFFEQDPADWGSVPMTPPAGGL